MVLESQAIEVKTTVCTVIPVYFVALRALKGVLAGVPWRECERHCREAR